MSEQSQGLAGRTTVTEGPFAGWWTWSAGADPFETLIGPFHYRLDETGRAVAAFEPRREHCNGSGALHGGLLMSFIDFTLFAIAHDHLQDVSAVTVSCNTEFVSAGQLSPRVEGYGEVIRATRSLIFVHGRLLQGENPIAGFSGILKRLHPRAA